jgi:hypothetical protein
MSQATELGPPVAHGGCGNGPTVNREIFEKDRPVRGVRKPRDVSLRVTLAGTVGDSLRRVIAKRLASRCSSACS